MKPLHFSLYLFLILSNFTPLCAVDAPSQLANPGFEEDADNVGFPDGWTVTPDSQVTLTRENPASGSRALVIQDGYAAVHQNLNIENLANRRVVLNLVARSPDGARLGVRFGYYQYDEVKGKKWVDVPFIWDKLLGTEYQTLTATRTLPEDALGERFWICLYRSQREGTVIVDDISLEFTDDQSSLDNKQSVVVSREMNYLKGKVHQARKIQPENPAWSEIQDGIDSLAAEQSFAEILGRIQKLDANLLAALYLDKRFTATWQEPYQRIEAGQLPAPEQEQTWKTTALPGETTALSVEVANTTTEPQTFALSLDGISPENLQMRRQVLMETWYTKGETLLADPLTLLKKNDGKWQLHLEPGEITRLHVTWKIAENAKGEKKTANLIIQSGKEEKKLPLELDILSAKPPTSPRLAHYQFLYTNMNVANDLPAETSRDLEAHGVTDIEWPFMPRAKFSADGKLAEVDWSTHDRWLAGFKNSSLRLNIFWEGSYKKMETVDGNLLEPGSKAWTRALQELLTTYLDRAESLGLPRERFTILPMDEIHSSHLDKAPDDEPFFYRDLAKAIAHKEQGLLQYLTIGNYAFPQDIEVVLPTLNVAMPHWPMPEKLGRNAPPDYSPRKAYFEKTRPMLEQARKDNDLQIWSYHVLRGKSSDVLHMSRAYPLLAVASGYTGFGYWAYNVTNGSSWDDQDGSIVDYSLIYDGRENHPLNKKYNITSEVIVPSIQWEAIRAGQQDGQILLYLQQRFNEQAPEVRSEIESLMKTVRQLGGEEGYGSHSLTFADVRNFSDQLRKVYAAAAEEK